MGALSGAFVLPRRLARVAKGELRAPSELAGLHRLFALATVFVAGWYLCLPESEWVQVPWWAQKHAIGPNILIHEAIFALYLVLGGARWIARSAHRERFLTLPAAQGLVLLAIWTGLMSLLAPYFAQDVGRSARLVFQVFLLLGVTWWSMSDPLFVLRAYMGGLAASSLVNLILTFQNPLTSSVLQRLLGQNSPGPPMGIAVCLAAWLIMLSRERRDALFAMLVAAICGFGALISYSKTGMLAAGMGVISLALVSGKVAPSRRGRLVALVLVTMAAGVGVFLAGERGRQMSGALSKMLGEKLASADVDESQSIQERLGYWKGVAEIVARKPWGVGYSGFKEAMLATDVYASGLAVEESVIPADESNPHAMFLYYASAGGVPGGVLAIAIFLLLCRAFVRGLSSYGAVGLTLALLVSAAYFVLGVSIPYLFNSSVMVIPAAIAAGVHARVRRARTETLNGS